MNKITRGVCLAVGICGCGYALYDGVACCKAMSKHQAICASQKHLENAYFNSRTLDEASVNQNNARKKVFDLRTKNQLPFYLGSIKGGINGFLYGLGANLPLVIFSSLAVLSKNFIGKIGAIGTICCGAYNVLRQGFGVGKKNLTH